MASLRQIAAIACLSVQVAAATEADTARQLLDASGVKGGLIVHLGCGDGKLTAALRASDSFIVHGLDADAKNVAAARKHIQSLGLYGKVSVEQWKGDRLPYADNLVNLIVTSGDCRVTERELLRVLSPNGVAITHHSSLVTLRKPWPSDIDEWTHYLHDASGNAVAHDRVVAAPERLQWLDRPIWSRSHEYHSSLNAMVSAQGRMFCIFDEGPTGVVDPRIPDQWKLIARDAFNGVVLWKRDINDWGWRAWNPQLGSQDWRRMGSQRAALPAALARRLVAAGERVYVTLGYQAPVTALDAATGRTLMTYAGTERTDEILHRDGRLVLCIRQSAETAVAPKGKKGRAVQRAAAAVVAAFDAATGRRLWQTAPGAVASLSLAVGGKNVVYHDQNGVVCLDADSGKPRWRATTGGASGAVTLVLLDKVVLCANQKELLALAVADGKSLWTLPGARGFGAINPPDLFVADGLVWYGSGKLEAGRFTGYDPLTGQPARTVDVGALITHGHHARCYRSKATDNFLLLPKRGVEFIDLHGQQHSRNNWVRGACRYGVVPCNGLLYSSPHPCFCYAGVKLGGFLALAPAGKSTERGARSMARLERGPAYDTNHVSRFTLHTSDWPMYRHDPKRSGSTTASVGAELAPAWKAQLGGKLTQPVVADGRVFVARVDAGQVCCLDAASGKQSWNFIAGGRVDSSPTYHKGRLIFGSADGYVYCLRASDGALAWRFRAAPEERRVVACGQLESAWPVHGSVLILNDTVYFTAGRSSFLDGGIFLYGLDPITGETRCETKLDGPHPDTKQLDENAYAMEGAKSDILVSDGKLLYLFHNVFNTRLEKQPAPVLGEPGVRNLGERPFGEHLFANAGFLDDSWFSRNHWMLGDHWTAFNFAHQAPKEGELLVFDDARTYAVKAFVRRNVLSPLFFPATDGYFVVADANAARPVVVNPRGQPNWLQWLPQEGKIQKCWNLDVGFARAEPPQWMTNVPVRIRAMVRTANALFAAGPPDVCDPDDPLGALEGRKGAVLLAFNPGDGKKIMESRLDAPPVFDSLIAANGRLYMAATDGHVLCFGGK
jgi:outer membrane protein assembly factor BamB